jgi:drug/metabolite transporter (DMT)-like permease
MKISNKGISFMILSALAFSTMGLMVRFTDNIPVFEKVFFRNLFSLFIVLFIVLKNKASLLGKKENQLLLMSRALLGVCGVILYFYAIDNMLLADASMLNKLSPFFVTLFAYLFLKEKISFIQIPGLILVFIGSLLIIKPQFDVSMIPALAGFASALCAGSAGVLVRVLNKKEDYSTIVFYFSFVSVIFVIPFMLFDFVTPNFHQLLGLLGTGVFAALYQLFLTLAYKYSKASDLAIYDYSTIVFSGLLGFIFYSEIPDVYSIIGGVLIICSPILVYLYKKRLTKQEEA